MKRAATVAVAALLVGCGVPEQGTAVVSDDDEVPFDLLAPSTTTTSTTSTTTAPPLSDRIVDICFVQGDGVLPIERTLPRRRTLGEVVELLRRGPTTGELAFGLTTAIPAPEAIGTVVLAGGTVTVALGETFTLAPVPAQPLAIAQLVCTLTSQPGVGRVQFLFEGQPVQVPLPDGSLSAGSVSRDDYAAMIRPPRTPTTVARAGSG